MCERGAIVKKNPHYNPELIVAMVAVVAIIALLIITKP